MRWYGNWWGIEIMADDEEDVAVLKALTERLPAEAEGSYTDGQWEYVDGYKGESWEGWHPAVQPLATLTLKR